MYIFRNSNNREIKINLACLQAFILQCFPNYKNGYLGKRICHQYFWHLHCQFWHGSLANGMAFQSCSVLFRDPIDLLLSCLSQT